MTEIHPRTTKRMPCEKKEYDKVMGTSDGKMASRLCYLLRYGAVKEQLQVDEQGFVKLDDLLGNRLLKYHLKDDVIHELNTSISKRRSLRFESKIREGVTYVRSRYCRRFEKNPYHEGTKVPTLLEGCLRTVCSNADHYDFEGFPAENIINLLLHRLKREKKLKGAVFKSLLSSSVEHLDLAGIYLTEGMLKALFTRCPNIRVISLQDSGYLINDHLLQQLARNLPYLESLNLSRCNRLTDQSLIALRTHSPRLKHLNINMIRGISEAAVLDLIKHCVHLEHLDIFDYKISTDGRKKILELAIERGITLVNRGITESAVAPEDPCAFLPNFGKVWY